MSNRTKNIIFSVILLSLVGWVYWHRTSKPVPMAHLVGYTMGKVEYNIKYLDEENRNFHPQIEELLKRFNDALSTYSKTSEITAFNQGSEITFQSEFWYPLLKRSKEIFEHTEGLFNPTIMPLVRAWGFAPEKWHSDSLSNQTLDSLKTLVDFNLLSFDEKTLKKLKQGVQLDFNAIAPGYAVDLIAQLLEKNNIHNYMVDIGGEVVCKGLNQSKQTWLLGIKNPNYKTVGQKQAQAFIRIENRAIATSGNYEKFYERNGKKYPHIINPKTGYPVSHNLLSVTVLTKDAISADAYATALMVMGTEKAKAFLQANQELGGFLIYDENGTLQTFTTENMKQFMVDEKDLK